MLSRIEIMRGTLVAHRIQVIGVALATTTAITRNIRIQFHRGKSLPRTDYQ